MVIVAMACGPPAPDREPAGQRVGPSPAEPVETPAQTTEHLVPAKVVPSELPEIYSEQGDMQTRLDEALATAKDGSRRVLIVFGGNWCTWCHKLHMLFERHEGIKNRLESSFVLLNVDSNTNEALIEKLGVKLEGVPFLVVLDPDGNIVVKQETGSLEDGPRHDPAKVLAFLDRWKPAA